MALRQLKIYILIPILSNTHHPTPKNTTVKDQYICLFLWSDIHAMVRLQIHQSHYSLVACVYTCKNSELKDGVHMLL